MKEETLKRNLHQVNHFRELVDCISEFLPDETDFGIFQFDPEGGVRVLHPIERPGFSAQELRQHIRSHEDTGEAFQQMLDVVSRPFIIEISSEGEINKLSLPGSGE